VAHRLLLNHLTGLHFCRDGGTDIWAEFKPHSAEQTMKSTLAIALVAISLASCNYRNSRTSAAKAAEAKPELNATSEDEKHRLYSAALAASESPLDTELFSDVCKKIGIYDVKGKPTDRYMPFVQAHIDWGTRPDNERFRQEINSKEKARDYLTRYLSAEGGL
jgi:hypothetical protein